MKKSEADVARDALALQDACNGAGVARSLVEAFDALAGVDTSARNRHPAIYMIAHKLLALAGHEDLSVEGMARYSAAAKACEDLARDLLVAEDFRNGILENDEKGVAQ